MYSNEERQVTTVYAENGWDSFTFTDIAYALYNGLGANVYINCITDASGNGFGIGTAIPNCGQGNPSTETLLPSYTWTEISAAGNGYTCDSDELGDAFAIAGVV